MKKAVYVVPNITGRIFICIDNDCEYIENFDDHFKVGEQYLEAAKGHDDKNFTTEFSNELLMLSENNIPLYTNSSNFLLIERSVNKIAITKMWKN